MATKRAADLQPGDCVVLADGRHVEVDFTRKSRRYEGYQHIEFGDNSTGTYRAREIHLPSDTPLLHLCTFVTEEEYARRALLKPEDRT